MRYNLTAVREYQDRNGETKKEFINLGVMFSMKNRDGFNILLNAIPAPVDGQYQILAFPPKEREEAPQKRQDGFGRGFDAQRPLDDEVQY